MGKQIRFYLLPADTERLFDHLKERIPLRFVAQEAPNMIPVEIETPGNGERVSAGRQYFLCETMQSKLQLRHFQRLSTWVIQIESEIVEFTACAFDGGIVRQGRFYVQHDYLNRGELLPKRPEFIAWADKLFRSAKRYLRWDAELAAYVGEDAERFRNAGGKFSQL